MTYQPVFGMNVLVETGTYNTLVTVIPAVAFFIACAAAFYLSFKST